jgi:uncharacterized protein
VKKLKKILQDMGKVLIAYSGGVDSTFLLKVAVDTLGRENVLAVTAKSPTYQAAELRCAAKNAKEIGSRHLVIATNEFKNARFMLDPPDRCYYCKDELFGQLKKIAKNENINFILDASNTDDEFDYRPGDKAKEKHGVKSPLKDAGFGKMQIRQFSRKLGLNTWNKPAMACLASRLPYGEEIKLCKLKQVELAEKFLQGLGFVHVRVRCHGDIARIEVPKKEIKLLCKDEISGKISKEMKGLGFAYVTLDLDGYRTGSLNEVLKNKR